MSINTSSGTSNGHSIFNSKTSIEKEFEPNKKSSELYVYISDDFR